MNSVDNFHENSVHRLWRLVREWALEYGMRMPTSISFVQNKNLFSSDDFGNPALCVCATITTEDSQRNYE